uniref:PAT complex subunit CCDC47 n=1 Tax=Heligmosomoides polygyrus TaxID=6339 RepID=A0A183GGM5_HELPZ
LFSSTLLLSTTVTNLLTLNLAQKPDDFDDDYGVVEDEEELKEKEDEHQPVQPLKFADVPAHFRSNWASYQVEALVLALIAMYLLNYVVGRNTNQSMALEWFDNVRGLLEQQFALVGDDGVNAYPESGAAVQRETDCSYTVWCSGRVGVNGMLIQVLLSLSISFSFSFMKKSSRWKKTLIAVSVDESGQCSLLASGDNSNGFSFALFAEQAEATYAIFEPGVVAIIKKYEKAIEHVHISDQYSGQKPPEYAGETYTRLPEVVRLVQFSLNLDECRDKDAQAELLHLMFYVVDKVRKFRMSKEAKQKADKRRREVEEAFIKTTHQLRQEAAQARREEKTRERKQRLLEEEDPEKQRRLEAILMS